MGQADLAVDLNTASKKVLSQLLSTGRQGASRLYYFTSGAGLWSRGGGQVKALIPFNIKDLLTAEQFELLAKSGDIVNASKTEDVLKLAERHLKPGEDAEKVAAKIVEERRKILSDLIAHARRDRRALNPLDMKLVNVAQLSDQAKAYVPFDIWTSEQTHAAIQTYLAEFRGSYRNKVFHPDKAIDAKIKESLGRYLRESDKRGETHLFGYQVGYHALDPATGLAVAETVPIGEGAGMAKAYLEESGRARRLREMGKNTMVFENIEVMTDLSVGMGAHMSTKKPVSVILVPERAGYKGGSPFIVERNGKKSIELHEMSALPEEFATGNSYFNSNTIFQSLDLAPPKNIGFELKNQGGRKIARVKMNAGDITLEAPTAGIGGRIGIEYENFKNYLEFGENGQKLIDTYRNIWTRDSLP